MKLSLLVTSMLFILTICFSMSCKQKTYNRYAYDQNKDTIPPVLAFTVPIELQNYSYGEDIHLVGTVTDLESKNKTSQKSGKLKSLYMNVSIMDKNVDTVIKSFYNVYLNVDGQISFPIVKKTLVNSGAGVTYCRFTGIATDYADLKDSVIVNFTVN
jgi:hypothetical protein